MYCSIFHGILISVLTEQGAPKSNASLLLDPVWNLIAAPGWLGWVAIIAGIQHRSV